MSAKTMEDLAQSALKEAFSASLLAALNGDQRDALLAKALKESLGGWEFRSEVEANIKARAMTLCQQIVESGAFDMQITEAIHAGIVALLSQLPDAVAAMFRESLFGEASKGGSYDRDKCGMILKHLKLSDPK